MDKTIEYLKGYYIGKREIYQKLQRIVKYSRITSCRIDTRVYVRNMNEYLSKELIEELNFALDMAMAHIIDEKSEEEIQKFIKDLNLNKRQEPDD